MPASTLTFRPRVTELSLDNGQQGFALTDVESVDFGDGITGTQAASTCSNNANPNQPQQYTIAVAARNSDAVDGEQGFVRLEALDGDHQVRAEITPAKSREGVPPPTIDLSFCDTDISASAGAIVAYLRVIAQSTPAGTLPATEYKIPLYAVA